MSKITQAIEKEEKKVQSVDDYKDLFTPFIKETPTLENALYQLYASENILNIKAQVEKIISESKKIVDKKFEEIKKIYPNLTKNEALIICSYKYKDEKEELSPSEILNKNLNDKTNGLKNISQYFFIFLKALRNLTPFNAKDKILYNEVNETERDSPFFIPYKEGYGKILSTFTSLKLIPNNNLKTGTKFSFYGITSCYDI